MSVGWATPTPPEADLSPMPISLVVATLQRVSALESLLESLCAQNYPGLDVIIVDQNADDRLAPVQASFQNRLALRRLRSSVCNIAHARNLGIASANGEIIGFPDDDCLYPSGTLNHVAGAFAANTTLAILTGPAFSPQGRPGSGRWQLQSGPIDMRNVWTTVIAFNMFLRLDWLVRVSGFDE